MLGLTHRTPGPNLLVQSRSSRDFAIQDDPQKHRQDLSQINYERNFWNILGQTTDQLNQFARSESIQERFCISRTVLKHRQELYQINHERGISSSLLVTSWSVTKLVTYWSVTKLVTYWSVTNWSHTGQWPHWSPAGQWPNWSHTGQWPTGHILVSDHIGHRLVSDQFEIPVSQTRYPRYRYLVLYFFIFCFLSRFQLKTLI